ncbi:MAG: Mth938-like domain-containing protein [Gammaproteobacteria bacterium]|nr:Mth938-like domain-containing protein [Gammaproteobacteria bacterium]
MQFTLETVSHAKVFTSYGEGFLEIDHQRYNSGLCLHGNTVFDDWQETDPKKLTVESLRQLIDLRPEILILGTGKRLVFPAPRLLAELHKLGVALETMDTSAACRTYNILVSERRRVAAALMLID